MLASSEQERDAEPTLPLTLSPFLPAPKEERRLIVVANRLPVTISKDASGEYHFKMSSGGLVSALSGCKRTMSFTWSASPFPPKGPCPSFFS